jgi:hypothetical protein
MSLFVSHALHVLSTVWILTDRAQPTFLVARALEKASMLQNSQFPASTGALFPQVAPLHPCFWCSLHGDHDQKLILGHKTWNPDTLQVSTTPDQS